MARTESLSFQIHPADEQSQINLMQRFHWNLLNSQEVKTKDSHLETRGDGLYSVTETEHYVKLTFSRDLEMPHLAEIRALEQEFNALPMPVYPKLFPMHILVWVVLALFWGAGVVIWILYFFLSYQPKKAAADQLAQQNAQRREEILQRLERLG